MTTEASTQAQTVESDIGDDADYDPDAVDAFFLTMVTEPDEIAEAQDVELFTETFGSEPPAPPADATDQDKAPPEQVVNNEIEPPDNQPISIEAARLAIKRLGNHHAAKVRTSYSDRNTWMRFHRQGQSTKKPVSATCAARFLADKQSLFAVFLESGEEWAVVDLIEERRQRHRKASQTKYRLMSRNDLHQKYQNPCIVSQIIKAKTDAGLFSADPNTPRT